jgi:glycosyltransferase involved in cell wall biosynthesis
VDYYDVGIATWWETAYILKKYEYKFRRQFYFVQDFEPYFYPLSSKYVMAENTYKFGFTHICSGAWCEKILNEKYGAKAVSFQFPLDRNIYNDKYVRNKKNKNIVFFAKPEMPRRCFEIGRDALEILKNKRPDIEIIMFGSKTLSKSQVPFEATILNIVPTLEGLAQIYANADLGIAFSITNPSLVPYEMISCGCPVADLDVEYALSKYGDNPDNVFLFDSLPERFAEGVEKIIDDDEILRKKASNAKKWVDDNFPSEDEMGRFVEKKILDEF